MSDTFRVFGKNAVAKQDGPGYILLTDDELKLELNRALEAVASWFPSTSTPR